MVPNDKGYHREKGYYHMLRLPRSRAVVPHERVPEGKGYHM